MIFKFVSILLDTKFKQHCEYIINIVIYLN